jgi:hypothetical protein
MTDDCEIIQTSQLIFTGDVTKITLGINFCADASTKLPVGIRLLIIIGMMYILAQHQAFN